MKKYGFDVEKLKRQKEYLENVLVNDCNSNSEKLNNLLNSIDNLQKIITFFCPDDVYDSYLEYQCYSSNMDFIKAMKTYVEEDDYNDEHKKIRNLLCNKLQKIPSRKNQLLDFNANFCLTDIEAVELVGDMIKKKLGKKHFSIYKEMFIDNPSHIQFSEEHDSLIYLGIDLDNIFVIINDKKDISKARDLAHEAGHYFKYFISNYSESIETSLDEVESTFYELLFIDFLKEENICKTDADNLLIELIDYTLTEQSAVLNAEFSYPMYKVNSVKDFKVMANKYDLYNKTGLFSTRELLSWIDKFNKQNSFTYIYSILIALELYDEYKSCKNRLSFMNKYEKFLQSIGSIPDFELASYICKDYITFNNFKTLKKYRSDYIK